jgi:hypothetical protein
MRSYNSVLLILCMGFFYACVSEEAPVTELEWTKRASGANSAEAFRNTVHPILLKRCASCHGDNGSNLRHSVSDYKQSHSVIVDGGKVDFSNPSNSRLVDKIINQRHNCWDGDCESSGSEMLAGIKEWIELRGVSQTKLDGATTNSLRYGNAVKTTPETINGSVLLQAEDGKLTGRMKTHVNAQASGFSYIAGDSPPVHPIEQTARAADISGNCRNVTAADLANTTTGRYKLTERKRHINQEGYRYYSQRIRFRIIRPDKRAEYQAEILAGRTSLPNLEKFFLATGPEDADNGFVLTGTAQLDRGTSIRTLPEFMEHGEYLTKINSQDPTYKDFFAPRFGDSGIDYFNPSNEEIRANIPSYLKNTLVFTKLQSSFLEYFYDFSGGNWIPENSIYGAPYIMRTMPDGNGGKVNFQINNQTAADNFYNYYWGTLTAANSLNPVSGSDSTHLIDTYVHYFTDPDDRDFEDFRWQYNSNNELFDLNRGNADLDLSALLADSTLVDSRAIMTENYGETLWPIVKSNCMGCHGDGSGRPQFAHANKSISFDAMIGFANFTVPENSRPATRMDEGHNCGANCASIKAEMVAAITSWGLKNTDDIEAAKSATAPELKALSDKDRSPARASYTINITEAGAYNVWFKVLTTDTKRRFDLRILDNQGRPVPNCTATSSCNTSATTYSNRTPAQIDDMFCREFNTGTHNEWSWYTPSINNLEDRIKWNLAKGTYTLEVIEEDVNAKIDIIAISKNPEFNPAKNLIDEGQISSAEPRILRYDVSSLINSPGVFEIEIMERNGGDAYIFRNPRFVGNTQKIKVKNIKVLVNDKYEFTDSSYTKINSIVGTEKTNLTYAPLVALSINGLGSDSFKFVFEDLKVTTAGETSTEDDAPVAVEGRKCQNLALFEATVMPILNRFRLIRKDEDGYTDYSSDEDMYPGTDRNAGANPQFYTCTTCHTENHPYFKMTTFFNNSEVLCEQALSRVDFGNFERSLLLRGLNGTFNHPKLHFVESVDLTGSGNSRRFKTNSNKVNGFDSSWAGKRFEKYTNGTGEGQINLGAYTGDERVYLEKFIGQYVKARSVTISDPFAAQDGEIRLPGDTYDPTSVEQDKWTYANAGRNMLTIVNPEDFVGKQGDLNPNSVTAGGIIKVKDSCINVNFNETNGVVTDPCNSDVDVITEFELIKTRYRESIINWMNEEKKSAN